MYTIVIYDNATKDFLNRYESNVLPMVGDIYGGSDFSDCKQRIVAYRSLIINKHMENHIIVYVALSHLEKF